MRNELETNFGRALIQLVAHLLKNAEKVPESILKSALEFEAFTWENLDGDTKRARVRAISECTVAPSAIHRHIEAYPHDFSKKRYADYLLALQLYQKSLAV